MKDFVSERAAQLDMTNRKRLRDAPLRVDQPVTKIMRLKRIARAQHAFYEHSKKQEVYQDLLVLVEAIEILEQSEF